MYYFTRTYYSCNTTVQQWNDFFSDCGQFSICKTEKFFNIRWPKVWNILRSQVLWNTILLAFMYVRVIVRVFDSIQIDNINNFRFILVKAIYYFKFQTLGDKVDSNQIKIKIPSAILERGVIFVCRQKSCTWWGSKIMTELRSQSNDPCVYLF